MVELNSKQQAFIRRMLVNEEYERHGVNLLVKHSNPEVFFDEMQRAGLFDPARNPEPLEAQKNSFRIPYWQILDYLKCVSRRSHELGDNGLATKILNVVRSTVSFQLESKREENNYYTASAFIEIFATVPKQNLLESDADFFTHWLKGKFSADMVMATIAEALTSFVESDQAQPLDFACKVIEICTVIDWTNEQLGDWTKRKAKSTVDEYWLNEAIEKFTKPLGRKVGVKVSSIFLNRVREAYSSELESKMSWLVRPAIEDHDQNIRGDGPANWSIVGLRDSLLSWCEVAPIDVKRFIDTLFVDDCQIVQRLAIYIASERFDLWVSDTERVFGIALSNSNFLHETFHLLRKRYTGLPETTKTMIVDFLAREITIEDEERKIGIQALHRNWLLAIAGLGDTRVDEVFDAAKGNVVLGAISKHPDFHSYFESRWGPGDSAYSPDELAIFSVEGSLIDRLNSFKPGNSWDGPTIRALSDALEHSAKCAPKAFLNALARFGEIKAPYQYGIISGYFEYLKSDESRNEKNRDLTRQIWTEIFNCFEALLFNEVFWNQIVEKTDVLDPTSEWIPPRVADVIREGVRKDEHAFSPDLLPRSLLLIRQLIRKLGSARDCTFPGAVSQAINSSKGKAIEALIDHSLRECRVADSTIGSHLEAWSRLEPIFSEQLALSQNGNFEFSTLLGVYILQIHYLDRDWYDANFSRIFPLEFPNNCLCALEGLSYAPLAGLIYRSLKSSGVLKWALAALPVDGDVRERILQRFGAAIIWGEEPLDGPLLKSMFDDRRITDLKTITDFFGSIRNQKLEPKHVGKVIDFWRLCVEWSESQDGGANELLSRSAALSSYINVMSESEYRLMRASALHLEFNRSGMDFIEALERSAAGAPNYVCDLLEILFEVDEHFYDYQGKMGTILISLANVPELKGRVVVMADRYRKISSSGVDVYRKIVDQVRKTN